MHILQIVIRNTSTLDTTIPLLWKIRRDHPEIRVSVLYCVADRRQILRDATYFDSCFAEWGIEQFDFGDFLKPRYRWAQQAWRKLFRTSPLDGFPLRTLLQRPSSFGLKAFLTGQPRVRKMLERKLGELMIDGRRILETLAPDVVLFDHRARVDFTGRDVVFEYLERVRRPVVLLPHAPHDIRATSEFTAFDEKGAEFPDYCLYWIAFRYGTPHLLAPSRRGSFVNVGYPGVDAEWISQVMRRGTPEARKERGVVRCLVMPRKFYAKGVPRPPSERFVAAYEDVAAMLRNVAEAVAAYGPNVVLVVKPHPSASRPHLIDMLKDLGIKRYEITYEPFYKLLADVDIVISGFTTSLILPLAYGIPTVILNSDVQEYVHEWDVLRSLYTGCRYFVEDSGDLAAIVGAMAEDFRASRADPDNADARHVRSFFPDGSLEVGLQLLTSLNAGRDPDVLGAEARGRLYEVENARHAP